MSFAERERILARLDALERQAEAGGGLDKAAARHAQGQRTARERLDRLLSQSSVYMFRHKLEPGLGYVSSDVLHNLTGFTDATGAGRLLLQTRHLDRILTFTG